MIRKENTGIFFKAFLLTVFEKKMIQSVRDEKVFP